MKARSTANPETIKTLLKTFPDLAVAARVIEGGDPDENMAAILKAIGDSPQILLNNQNGLKQAIDRVRESLKYNPDKTLSDTLDQAVISLLPGVRQWDEKSSLMSMVYPTEGTAQSIIYNMRQNFPLVAEIPGVIHGGHPREIVNSMVKAIQDMPQILLSNPKGLNQAIAGARESLQYDPDKTLNSTLDQAVIALLPGIKPLDEKHDLMYMVYPDQRGALSHLYNLQENIPGLTKLPEIINGSHPQAMVDRMVQEISINPQILLSNPKGLKTVVKGIRNHLQYHPGLKSVSDTLDQAVISLLPEIRSLQEKSLLMHMVYPDQRDALSHLFNLQENIPGLTKLPEIINGSHPQAMVDRMVQEISVNPQILLSNPKGLKTVVKGIRNHLQYHPGLKSVSDTLDQAVISLLPNVQWEEKESLMEMVYPDEKTARGLMFNLRRNFPELTKLAGVADGSHPRAIVDSMVGAISANPRILLKNNEGLQKAMKGMGSHLNYHPNERVVEALRKILALPELKYEDKEVVMGELYPDKKRAMNEISNAIFAFKLNPEECFKGLVDPDSVMKKVSEQIIARSLLDGSKQRAFLAWALDNNNTHLIANLLINGYDLKTAARKRWCT